MGWLCIPHQLDPNARVRAHRQRSLFSSRVRGLFNRLYLGNHPFHADLFRWISTCSNVWAHAGNSFRFTYNISFLFVFIVWSFNSYLRINSWFSTLKFYITQKLKQTLIDELKGVKCLPMLVNLWTLFNTISLPSCSLWASLAYAKSSASSIIFRPTCPRRTSLIFFAPCPSSWPQLQPSLLVFSLSQVELSFEHLFVNGTSGIRIKRCFNETALNVCNYYVENKSFRSNNFFL